MTQAWPAAAEALLKELSSHPGRLCLMLHLPEAARAERSLSQALGTPLVKVGQALTADPSGLARAPMESVLSDAMLLTDLDILFTPELKLDPLRLLRDLSKRAPRIAVWPGRISESRTTYSEPGRPDHYDAALENTIILQPRTTTFPDEVPYTEERIR